MPSLMLAAARKVAGLFSTGGALEAEIEQLAQIEQTSIPAILASEVRVTAAPASMSELQQQLGFPRIAVFCNRMKNALTEKFRAFSGSVTVVVEITASGALLDEVDTWTYCYVTAVTSILSRNRGVWDDGLSFAGAFDVEIQPPKTGGSGFVQSARVSCEIEVSSN